MTNKEITNILSVSPNIIFNLGKEKVFDFLEDSRAFSFNNKQFDNNNVSIVDELPDFPKVSSEMSRVIRVLTCNLNSAAIVIELGGGMYQRRSGYPGHYFPIDISRANIINNSKRNRRFGLVCNAGKLPFIANTFYAVFTHAFFEHPNQPANVVSEIIRVVKPEGIVIHCDAWNSRWWSRFGIRKVRKFGTLSPQEKLLWILIAISEFPLIRLPPIFISRFFEVVLKNWKRNKMKFKRLKPNYDLHVYSDVDAAAGIDPINLLFHYQTNGFEELSIQRSLLSRVF